MDIWEFIRCGSNFLMSVTMFLCGLGIGFALILDTWTRKNYQIKYLRKQLDEAKKPLISITINKDDFLVK